VFPRNRLLTLVVGACLGAPLLAQETFGGVYQRALRNDPAIHEAEATYLALAEVKPQARASLLPALTLGASRAHRFQDTNGGALDPITGVQIGTSYMFEQESTGWSLSLSQTVFDWRAHATLRQADKRVVRAETDYRAAQQSLVLRVATAYFNVLAAEDNLVSASAAREAVSRQLDQAKRRFAVGQVSVIDVQQSMAGYDNATATEIEARHQVSIARESLRKIVGDVGKSLARPTEDLPLLTPDPADADDWVRVALNSNLALLSTRIAAEVAEDDVAIQKATRLPTLNLSASYTDDEQNRLQTLFRPLPQTTPSTQLPQGRSWSLDLRFPIVTGGLNRSRIRQSIYQHRAATDALEGAERETEDQTRQAYLGVISNIERVRALKQSVESNRAALRATEAGFSVGRQNTVDVLAALNSLRSAETTYARSRYDYLLNLLLLKQAAGSLSDSDVTQVDGWFR
jgi:outer membrane protein